MMIEERRDIVVVVYIFGVLIIGFTFVYIFLMEIENIKLKRNPIPKKSNSDKRFYEIANVYSHKIFEIVRGN